MAGYTPEELANLAKLMADNAKITTDLTQRTTDLKDAIQNNIDVIKNKAELLEKTSQLEALQLQQAEAMLKMLSQDFDQREKTLLQLHDEYDANEKIIDLIKEKIRITNDDISTLKANGVKTTEDLEKLEKLQQNLEKYNKDNEENIKNQTKIYDAYVNLESIQQETIRGNEKILEQQAQDIISKQKLNEATKSLTASISQSIAGQAGLNSQYNQQIQLAQQAGGVTGVLKMSLAGLTQGFMQAFNPVTMFSTVLTNAIQNFQKFYDAMAKVTRELGTTVSTGFNAAAAAGARMGVDSAAQTATVNALGTAFVNLGNKQREQTTQLLVASYEMQRFGIGAAESITILSGFQRSLGLSAEKSAQLATDLVHTARGLGLTADAVKGLASNMETFIAYGSRANEVMKETLEVSSKFGIGTDAIAKMTAKLDTLEGSLNAANTVARELGVAIDPLQLLRADPAQKMQLVADAIRRSGFEGENARFKIKVLADSLGLTNAQIEMLTKQAEQSSNSIGSWEKTLRSLDTMFQKFTDGQTLDGLAQLKTLLESATKPLMFLLGALNVGLALLLTPLNMFVGWLNKIGTFFGVGLGDALALGTVAILLFSANIGGMLVSLAATATGALSSIGAGLSGMITTTSAAATAAAEGIPFLLAFGAAIFLIGIGIGMAAAGMALLIKSFKDLTGDEIVAASMALLGIALGLFAVGAALTALGSNPFTQLGIYSVLALGAAILLVGIGIKMATEGIASMVSSVAELATALAQLKDVDIDGTITKVIKSIIVPFSEAPADFDVKVKAAAQLPPALKEYAEALQIFTTAGGAANAQVMTEKFVETMTKVSEKSTSISTSTKSTSGGLENSTIYIQFNDESQFKAYVKSIVNDDRRYKQAPTSD